MTSEDRATRTSRRDSAREAASDARTRASELRIEGLDADADVLDKLVGVLDEVAAGKLRGATTGKLVDNAKKEIARLGVKNPTSKTRELFPSAPSSFEGSFDQGHEEGESEETLPAYVTSEYVASPRQHQNGAVTVKRGQLVDVIMNVDPPPPNGWMSVIVRPESGVAGEGANVIVTIVPDGPAAEDGLVRRGERVVAAADDVVEPAVAAVAVAVDPGLSKRDSDAEREVNITRTITRVRSSTIASEASPPPPGRPPPKLDLSGLRPEGSPIPTRVKSPLRDAPPRRQSDMLSPSPRGGGSQRRSDMRRSDQRRSDQRRSDLRGSAVAENHSERYSAENQSAGGRGVQYSDSDSEGEHSERFSAESYFAGERSPRESSRLSARGGSRRQSAEVISSGGSTPRSARGEAPASFELQIGGGGAPPPARHPVNPYLHPALFDASGTPKPLPLNGPPSQFDPMTESPLATTSSGTSPRQDRPNHRASRASAAEGSPRARARVETKLRRHIGTGANGSVYVGECGGEEVLSLEPATCEDIKNEIRILRNCDCEHIDAFVREYQMRSTLWVVMEFCEAGSTLDVMRKVGRGFDEPCVAGICRGVLRALEYMHVERKVIHRDIKAANVLLDARGGVKLADLGVVAQLQHTMSKRGTMIGTPHWMAPESLGLNPSGGGYNPKGGGRPPCQFPPPPAGAFVAFSRGACPVDVWGLGITAIELVEMKPPFNSASSVYEAMMHICQGPAATLKPETDASPLLREFISASLVKDPNERPAAGDLLQHPFLKKASAEALASIVARLLDGEFDAPPAPPKAVESLRDSFDASSRRSSLRDSFRDSLASFQSEV
ncbi:putative Serine/threonine-protein kinase [Emiliania huxleyi CCMP1516]|uniref:Protein kinase domain-containing protein n=2 Tax=Emiliania huxleyi TaxID=2903 RepID=A0A0D3IUB0_EMIH1|nr:putative Serine/threonine-protein kinase [Emiliania huxleyi CCMP1516]EOD14845.1 putative Serine/threonine-protein kinase [Emiliania huxleyi CCMP1516]|eukprot:XP_005767274.1 putative Serine/threonine-protein kinase [Emiliania huxleyi CCMP1516]